MFFRRFIKKKTTNSKELEDTELIRRYQDPNWDPPWDIVFVGELFQRYMHLIYGVCLKYLRNDEDAKDAVMQIFEKLVVELKRNANQDKHIKHFKSWLYTLVRNHCLMWLRSRQSKNGKEAAAYSLEELVGHTILDGEDGLDMEMLIAWHSIEEDSLEQDLTLIEKGMQELPIEQRRCLDLFYIQQKCYKEIAELTGYDLNKVKSYIQNGKRNLKIFVEKSHE